MNENNKDSKDTSLFTMIPDELLAKYDYKHMILLSSIARLSFTSGYCSASNDYLFKRIHNLTRSKINASLDWLEGQGLIVRYNQLNMVNGDFLRTKRLIVLSQYSYGIYQSINSKVGNKMHKPIGCPNGFLLHDEYLKKTKGKQKINSSDVNKNEKKTLNKNNQGINEHQEQSKNNHVNHLNDNVNKYDVFLSDQNIENKNNTKSSNKGLMSSQKRNDKFIELYNIYSKRGDKNALELATKDINKLDDSLASQNK